MIAAERAGTFLRLEHTVLRKSTVSDQGGGPTITGWPEIGKVQGSDLAPQIAREAFFVHQLEVRRQAVLWVDDTVGIKSDDRIRDPSGKDWEIIGIAAHGPLKNLRLVEAR